MPIDVLVVDDNRIMRRMIAQAVQASGLEVGAIATAGDGREALAALRAAPAGLVLLDVNMPVMDGEAFLSALRADPAIAATPVLVVSTESSPARVARLRALGAGFVHKPFRPEELVAAAAAVRAGGRP